MQSNRSYSNYVSTKAIKNGIIWLHAGLIDNSTTDPFVSHMNSDFFLVGLKPDLYKKGSKH